MIYYNVFYYNLKFKSTAASTFYVYAEFMCIHIFVLESVIIYLHVYMSGILLESREKEVDKFISFINTFKKFIV